MEPAEEDEKDVLLQRTSPELLADFQKSLGPFLWTSSKSSRAKIRKRVRLRETDRLVNLLEPFQELPQLLDPHLNQLVPVLADALLACLQSPPSTQGNHASTKDLTPQLLHPLSTAICRLLYTLCKVRGEKVIVRFLSTEIRHIEVLLSAVENGTSHSPSVPDKEGLPESAGCWEWEERYITMFWLSQLLLAPFDLATISSDCQSVGSAPAFPGLVWPANIPSVTLRVIPLALRFLSSAGRERDAAKALLVRVAMRRDMQELRILETLVNWALFSLTPSSDVEISAHFFIGVLSFLAGLLSSSSSTRDLDSYLPAIFQRVREISAADNPISKSLHDLATARKTIVKVLRSIGLSALYSGSSLAGEMVETIIGDLLEYLADSATPVRLAASKALSIITLKLNADMASEVIEAVLQSLERNVLPSRRQQGSRMGRDIQRVNPYEWHGLILTLSHLLYRHSPPVSSLPEILDALLLGLSFEQKSVTGASVGTNVRDAACFGIWALARRYTTTEIQDIACTQLDTNNPNKVFALQRIATALVTTASLDPAGNIRRGSSAALQELIGRHPNSIEEGIQVVQVVDYHAVALRSRAISKVAIQAAKLSDHYYLGLFYALLDWQGVQDINTVVRRDCANALGALARIKKSPTITSTIIDQIKRLETRDVEELHGLLLCLSSIPLHSTDLSSIVDVLHIINNTQYRRLELVAEATCRLLLAIQDVCKDNPPPNYRSVAQALLDRFMKLNEGSVDVVAEAATDFLAIVSNKHALINVWIEDVAKPGLTSGDKGKTYLHTLFRVLPTVDDPATASSILTTILRRWSLFHNIEARATFLRCLCSSRLLFTHTNAFLVILADGLDDYTTNARGDIGSIVRIEALKAVTTLWECGQWIDTSIGENRNKLVSKVFRLSVEKLDKVRIEAQKAVFFLLSSSNKAAEFKALAPSSQPYFLFLLQAAFTNEHLKPRPDISNDSQMQINLLEGFVSSADTGSEELIRASRAAVVEFCERDSANIQTLCMVLDDVLKINSNNDRVLVPAMEVLSFLFDMGIVQRSSQKFDSLYRFIQKAHYKTGNVRKLEASVKLYGGLSEVYPEALEKLVKMLLHPFPKVRNTVADELWIRCQVGKGVDWTRAKKEDVDKISIK